ncbi:MAG: tRNA (adenosine(37)-N6)-dimethylallyltransferase MiaA [Candidatus Hydrogenedentes bacterium]|nr:tRNA (adenosine(37)-N6)-dimethylallyltransferase MiaA [Candidatus Hydrogenedentota bacterium]
MSKNNFKSILILGPTASGKTKIGVQIAYRFNGEIISADSRQVYIGLDIGTGKDLAEYSIVSPPVPYHLIDIVSPKHEFSLYEFIQHFNSVFELITNKGKLPIIVGGTGMYLEAILEKHKLPVAPPNFALREELQNLGLEELQDKLISLRGKVHNTTDLLDRERLIRAIEITEAEKQGCPYVCATEIYPLVIGISHEREVLKIRISQRLKKRLEEGLIDEVKRLREEGITDERLYQLGLEYRYVLWYLQGRIKNKNDLFQKLRSAIWEFSRRQMMWFRRFERKGIKINWFCPDDIEKIIEIIKRAKYD